MAVEVKVGTRLLVGVGVGPDAPMIKEPMEQPRLPNASRARIDVIETVLRLMIYPSYISSSS